MDPRLAECLRGKPPAGRPQLLRIAQTIQRRGVVLRSRLAALLRYLGLPARDLHRLVLELEAAGLVELVGPGYQRRGLRYRWCGSAEPIAIDRQLVTNEHEARVIDVLRGLNGGWCHHSCLLRRVSPSGIRARELGDLLYRARRWGLVEMLRTLRGGRAYRWIGPGPAAAVAPVVVDTAARRRIRRVLQREAARLLAQRDPASARRGEGGQP